MFSQTAEYALRAVVWLAGHADRPQAVTQIAESIQVPPGYLAKVLHTLGRGGIVSARRGVNGGFVLNRRPEAITILDVVNAVDPIRRIDACPLGLRAHATRLCALHQRLDNAIAGVEQVLAAATVAEVMDGSSEVHPFDDPACGSSRPAAAGTGA